MLESPLAAPAEGSPDAAAATGSGDKKAAVYLAETSFDLKSQRDSIKRELAGHGYQVLPDRPLPLVAGESEAVIKEQLAESVLSIHLVGHNYGLVPEGATESMVVLQNECAIERGAAGDFSRLIWMPPDLVTDDERQLRFIDRLRTDPRIQEGADVLEIGLEDFKSAIHRKLEPSAEEPAAEAGEVDTGDDLRHIYVVCDQRDLDHTLPLEDFLYDQGYEVVVRCSRATRRRCAKTTKRIWSPATRCSSTTAPAMSCGCGASCASCRSRRPLAATSRCAPRRSTWRRRRQRRSGACAPTRRW